MTSDTRRPIRVGIIDSGINSRQAKLVAASVNFTADQNSNSVADKLGHGEALAKNTSILVDDIAGSHMLVSKLNE